MATKVEIAKMVGVISEAFPNWKPTEKTLDVYFQFLNDIDGEELQAAAAHCICESGRAFAPSVGEIRGAVSGLRVRSANVPSSYQAWQEVCKQIAVNGGDYGKPVFSNPIVKKAVDAIGWRNLRMSEDQTADRARFLQCYEQLLSRAANDDIMLPSVRGFIEQRQQYALTEIKNLTNLLEAK